MDNTALSLWNSGTTRDRILQFVDDVTSESSDHFVPPADRIATFDNDGTLWSEQPVYFQLLFAFDRARDMAPDHPEWSVDPAISALLDGDLDALAAEGEAGVARIVGVTHAGMTSEAFAESARIWIDSATHPSTGRKYTDMTFAPMVQLLEYLRANDFKTFIVSGGGIEFLRVFAQEAYGIPPEQVVGTTIRTKYEVVDGTPTLVRLPEIAFVDDKEGKPVGINAFIGKRPILSGGNSDGDFQMLEYTTAGDGKRLGLLVHHDDADREFAYDRASHCGRLDRGLNEAADRGWLIASMKNDFAIIYD